MKKMRRLIPAIAMLLVSAVMLSTASFAWFTMSTSAKATGMTVSAVANSSLLIVADEAAGTTAEKFMSSNGVATFNTKGTDLLPATHYDATKHMGEVDAESGEQAALTGVNSMLVYIDNPECINPATGNATNGTAVYAAVAEGTASAPSSYYKDYTVFLGTAGDIMTGALSATVSATDLAKIHNAIAIDFWTASASTTDGTLTTTAKEYKATTWLGTSGTEDATVSLGNVSIPQAVAPNESTNVSEFTGAYFVVVMRVYFDGAYQDTDGAFVRDAYTNESEMGFNVTFDVAVAGN